MPSPIRSPTVLVTLLAAAVAAGGCATPPSPESTGSQAAVAVDEQGPFRLELELPKAAYAAGERINGVARLRYAGPGRIDVGGSGSGLIGFSLVDVDRQRSLGGGQTGDCRTYTLDPAAPLTSGLTKSGGYEPDNPAHDWIEAFLADPVYRLPAGTWEIQAWASFLGASCTLPSTELNAAVRIVVTD